MNHDLINPDDFILPAVEGSLNILRAASRSAGCQLSLVLFTSSVVTLLDPRNSLDHVYSESDHSDYFQQEAQRLGAQAPSRVLYVASKVAAEKAVWQYRTDFQVRSLACLLILENTHQRHSAAVCDKHYPPWCGDWSERSARGVSSSTTVNTQTNLESFLRRGQRAAASSW